MVTERIRLSIFHNKRDTTKAVSGEVVSRKGQTLTVRDPGGEHTVMVTDSTQILIRSELKPIDEIAVGDQVQLVYRDDADKKIAIVVNITAKK